MTRNLIVVACALAALTVALAAFGAAAWPAVAVTLIVALLALANLAVEVDHARGERLTTDDRKELVALRAAVVALDGRVKDVSDDTSKMLTRQGAASKQYVSALR